MRRPKPQAEPISPTHKRSITAWIQEIKSVTLSPEEQLPSQPRCCALAGRGQMGQISFLLGL